LHPPFPLPCKNKKREHNSIPLEGTPATARHEWMSVPPLNTRRQQFYPLKQRKAQPTIASCHEKSQFPFETFDGLARCQSQILDFKSYQLSAVSPELVRHDAPYNLFSSAHHLNVLDFFVKIDQILNLSKTTHLVKRIGGFQKIHLYLKKMVRHDAPYVNFSVNDS
jgi:hypothetical protein